MTPAISKDCPISNTARLLAAWILTLGLALGAAKPSTALFTKDAVILFQGDSVTHAGKDGEPPGFPHGDPNHGLGHSYAFMLAAALSRQYPERNLTFLNKAVSGSRVEGLLARWQKDTIDLKPDVLSILIGVEDRTVAAATYEKQYDQLLAMTVAALPKVKLVICEPFLLPADAQIRAYQAVARRLADKYHVPLVRLQHCFDEEDKRADPGANGKYWIEDTVHPTYAGHQLIADEWIRTVDAFYGVAKP